MIWRSELQETQRHGRRLIRRNRIWMSRTGRGRLRPSSSAPIVSNIAGCTDAHPAPSCGAGHGQDLGDLPVALVHVFRHLLAGVAKRVDRPRHIQSILYTFRACFWGRIRPGSEAGGDAC